MGVERAGQGKDEEQSCVAREGGSREGRKGVEMAGRRSESSASARPAAILTPLICRRKDGASRGGEREWGLVADSRLGSAVLDRVEWIKS